MTTEGTYEPRDGRPALRFESHLRHGVDAVWHALTEVDDLAQWFPCAVKVEGWQAGTPIAFDMPGEGDDGTTGEVLAADPPRLLAFLWGEEELRFELAPDGDGTRLTFVHVLSEESTAARTFAGWAVCLRHLEDRLAGGEPGMPGSEPTDEWRERYDEAVAAGVPSGAPIP